MKITAENTPAFRGCVRAEDAAWDRYYAAIRSREFNNECNPR